MNGRKEQELRVLTGSISQQARMCSRCIMDSSDPDITFDVDGICNHCRKAEQLLSRVHPTTEQADAQMRVLAQRVKKASRGGQYDCVIGLSGGVDSSYTAYLARRYNLRPLAVHFDNGWDTELAVENIQRVVEALDIDLETYVVDWSEFRDLQRAFLLASVIDFELATDHAIVATMLRTARRYKTKFVFMGTNIATEHGLPAAWTWLKTDWTNIKAIHKAHGSVPLKTFPHFGTLEWGLVRVLGIGLSIVRPLNLINYRREAAAAELANELGWREYGGKHHESLITKFYQGYILPTKFGIDKRRSHLSDRIRSGELTRQEALTEIAGPAYVEDELARERDYVLKKLGFSEEQFDTIMRTPPRPHDAYPSDQWWAGSIRKLVFPIRRI